jgi:hypothetical protein
MTATIAPSGRLHRGRTTWLMYGALGLLNYMISGVGPALPLLGGLVIACGTKAACTLGGALATPWVEVPLWVMGHRRAPPPARRCPPASGGRFTSRATPGRHAAGADGMTHLPGVGDPSPRPPRRGGSPTARGGAGRWVCMPRTGDGCSDRWRPTSTSGWLAASSSYTPLTGVSETAVWAGSR